MPHRFALRAILIAALTTASLTCGDGSGPDPGAVALVRITPASGSLDTGDSLQLTASARNAAGTELTGKTIVWTTLTAALVDVGSNGLVRARWPGLAGIVATSEQRSDTAWFQVVPKINRIALTVAFDTLTALFAVESLRVRAFIGTQSYPGGSYAWSLSNTAVAQLFAAAGQDSVRQLQALANGSTYVRVVEARGARDSARVVVRQRPRRISFGPVPLRAYRACPFRLIAFVADSFNVSIPDAQVTWTSTDTTLARIDSTGLLTPLAPGVDTIVAQAGPASQRTALTISVAPTVTLQTFGVVAAVTTVGVGQYAVARAGGAMNDAPARFSVVSSDPSILTVPYDSTVPMGWLDLALLHLVGQRTGTVTLTPYLCDVPGPPVSFTVTRPKLGLAGDLVTTARIDDPPVVLNIVTRDSTGAGHYVAEPLVVRVTGTDSAVLRPDSGYHHIPAGSANSYVFFSYPDSGSARLVVRDSAGRYIPDSTALIHVAYPPVYFADALSSVGGDTLRVAMRQRIYPPDQPFRHHHVVLDRYVVGAPIPIQLSTSNSAVVRVSPDSVAVPVGVSGAPIDIVGGDVRGIATLTARAHRHIDGQLVVKTDRPRVGFYNFGSGQYPGDSLRVGLFAYDSANGVRGYPTEDVTFTLSVNDTSVVSLHSAAVTFLAGAETSSVAFAVFKRPGIASVTVMDPRAAPYAYPPETTPEVTVLEPYLSLDSVGSLGIGQKQHVNIVENGPHPGGDVVHVRQRNPAVVSLSDTLLTIGVGETYGTVIVTGTASGVDTVIVSATGYRPDTSIVTVGPGTIFFGSWPSGMTVGDSVPLWFYLAASDGTQRATAETVTFTLAPNSNIEFRQDGAVIPTVTIPAGGTYTEAFLYMKAKAAGTGSATISAPNYTPLDKSVTVAP